MWDIEIALENGERIMEVKFSEFCANLLNAPKKSGTLSLCLKVESEHYTESQVSDAQLKKTSIAL